jgi:hypothetical protein
VHEEELEPPRLAAPEPKSRGGVASGSEHAPTHGFRGAARHDSRRFNKAGDDWGTLRSKVPGTIVRMRDTSEPALERYYELLRARTPLARLTAAVDLSSAVRQLAESSVRAAEPSAPTQVVRARLTLRLYGREVAARLFPGVELDVG